MKEAKIDFEKFKDIELWKGHESHIRKWYLARRLKKKRSRLKKSMPSKRKRRAYWKKYNPLNPHR